jgi:hypothetical protein
MASPRQKQKKTMKEIAIVISRSVLLVSPYSGPNSKRQATRFGLRGILRTRQIRGTKPNLSR